MEKFIIGIREHPLFGYIIVPLIVGNCNEEYCRIIRSVVFQDIIDDPQGYTQIQKEVVSIIDNYSDDKIYAYFNRNKKLSITEYFATLKPEVIEQQIRPYIERHIAHLLKILKNSELEIFYKPYRYEYIYYTDKITINDSPGKAIFNFERNEDCLKYYLTVSFNNKEISIYKKKPIILLNNPAVIELEHILMTIEKIDAKKLVPFYRNPFVKVRKELELTYFKNFILKTVRDFDVRAKGFEIINVQSQKIAKIEIENDWLSEFAIIPKFNYNGRTFKPGDKLTNFVELDEKTMNITKFSRDLMWELKHINFLINSGLIQKNDNVFKVPYPGKDKNHQHRLTITWLNENYDKLKKFGFEITQRFSEKKYFVKKIKLNFSVKNKIDWFDIAATVTFGDFEIPFYKLRTHILNGLREYELPNGEIAIIPEIWFKKYTNILKFAKKTKAGHLKIGKIHYFTLIDAEATSIDEQDTSQLDKFFANPAENTVKLPVSLKTKLRSYQKIGYSWLNHLRKNKFGGCLADDMGLGKTVQVLSTILKNLEENGQIKNGKSLKHIENRLLNLVIVPRSLLHNWYNEVQKFTPSINAMIYAGNERLRLRKKLLNSDLIITSYGIARNDLEFFSKLEFNYIVLDESHYIKNSSSKTYQAIKQLNGKYKLVMTGTPIENSLRDLWTQLNFVNPGMLGSLAFFKEHFITPIERYEDKEASKELKRIIAPFIMRRTKEEVEKDLPDIEEQTIICEMTDEQQILYEEEKSKIRNKVLEMYNKGSLRQSQVYVLQALMKLRQIAIHPKMIGADVETSGKFDIVMDRLEELIKEKHKVLIFSTFVKLLNIFEDEFKKKKWKFLKITGQTSKRQTLIDKFQKENDTKLFLISIKAGGVGVNLTAADYVFILDPWWNPAVERQAIARSHRIGQTKNVFAFRFITFDTIEEKIQLLQQKKQKLAFDFIDDNNYFKYFDEENIVSLFD